MAYSLSSRVLLATGFDELPNIQLNVGSSLYLIAQKVETEGDWTENAE